MPVSPLSIRLAPTPDWRTRNGAKRRQSLPASPPCSSLRVPTVSVVIGEGGSGGALALAVADRMLMLEHSTFTVASPEAAAAILWRDSAKAPDAAANMRITAQELYGLGLIDEIIPEPVGGLTAISAVRRRGWPERSVTLPGGLERPVRRELAGQRYNKYRDIRFFAE